MENNNIIEVESIQLSPSTQFQAVNHSHLSNFYLRSATSHNTRKAYRSDIQHYEDWGGKLPATPEMIAAYLYFFADKLNPRTLARRLVALKQWHTYQGFNDPTLHPTIKETMAGILRIHGKPKAKARPITPEELIKIHCYLIADGTLTSLRDDALLQIAFFGALRRSELVTIQIEHIHWDKAGIEILLPISKTDQTHEGQYCAIPYGHDTLCPVNALKIWLEKSNITTGPIFRRITLGNHVGLKALTPLTVNHIIKKHAENAGIHDANTFSAHSLRRGLATSAAQSGAPLQAIMRAGRWKQTNTIMEYIETSERFTNNAAANVLKTLVANENE